MNGDAPAPAPSAPASQPQQNQPVHSPTKQGRKFDLLDTIVGFSKFIPSVQKPLYKQSFNTRMMWVGVALLAYLILSHITVIGVDKDKVPNVGYIEIVLGASFGSMMTLGIGPIVTAGIILQLLVGSKIINLDMSKPDSRKKFQSTSKVLAVVFAVVESIAYVSFGALGPVAPGPTMALVMAQLALGGLIVILLDDLVSKWGFGSGISLFIAAGVGNQIFIRVLSPFTVGCEALNFQSCIPNEANAPIGLLWNSVIGVFGGDLTAVLLSSVPILSTIGVFLLIVYVQGIRVEVPLAFSALRGFGRNWSLKLFYTSNVPVILTTALLANLQLMSSFGMSLNPETGYMCSILGCVNPANNNTPVDGVLYYLSSPGSGGGILVDIIGGVFVNQELLRILTYAVFLTVGSIIFSVFWMSTAGMDAKTVAGQIQGVGLQIPGYRRDPRIIESVLNRYIPHLAVLGGFFVGLLAAFADTIGAIGTGTGILLTVMIVYNYYEELRNQDLEGAHPIFRKMLGA
ncbi:MAG: preprotein translocase subunit SecY [Candidatus Aenigmarchaeota archaeon]|nr:preprotein translocase subunit SecY [Candidatus Aenigmarchaeota archaeon]